VRIAFLGFGLIAGSIARALRAGDGEWSLVAWSPRGDGPRAALAGGVLDEAAPGAAQAINRADLVVLAAPPLETLALLDELGGPLLPALARDAVVTDVTSTKRQIVARAEALGLAFVGGHPMAGRETSGYTAADPSLFVDRPWIVCPGSATEREVATVEDLALAVGARPLRMDPEVHDRAVAAISHLPLVLAAALVESVAGVPGSAAGARQHVEGAGMLAASGWRDMTRLARGDVAMGAGIAATNADFLAERIRALRGVLDAWLVELEIGGGPDADRLAVRLADARRLVEAMDEERR
jgi:prephenate dehydrogenase